MKAGAPVRKDAQALRVNLFLWTNLVNYSLLKVYNEKGTRLLTSDWSCSVLPTKDEMVACGWYLILTTLKPRPCLQRGFWPSLVKIQNARNLLLLKKLKIERPGLPFLLGIGRRRLSLLLELTYYGARMGGTFTWR